MTDLEQIIADVTDAVAEQIGGDELVAGRIAASEEHLPADVYEKVRLAVKDGVERAKQLFVTELEAIE